MIRLVFPPFYHSLSPVRGEAGGWGGDTTLELNKVNAFQTVTVQQCRFSKSSPSSDLQPRSCSNLGFKEVETHRLADATQKVQAMIVYTIHYSSPDSRRISPVSVITFYLDLKKAR